MRQARCMHGGGSGTGRRGRASQASQLAFSSPPGSTDMADTVKASASAAETETLPSARAGRGAAAASSKTASSGGSSRWLAGARCALFGILGIGNRPAGVAGVAGQAGGGQLPHSAAVAAASAAAAPAARGQRTLQASSTLCVRTP